MSSREYISYPTQSTPSEILAEIYSYIKTRSPSWRENNANLDTWILQGTASHASDLRSLMSDVPAAIFRYFGMVLLNLPPIGSAAASVDSTWTVQDAAGYTIPSGTNVSIRDELGTEFAFHTIVDVIIPGGQTTAVDVPLVAVIPGAAASDLGGVGVEAVLIDTLAYVVSVELEGATSGGTDPETTSQYNNRLARRLARLSTRPILPEDFANMALDIPGVFRAVAIDGYNPDDDTYNNERMVTVSAIDVDGNEVSTLVKDEIDDLLQENREITFIINVIDPNYTIIDVQFSAKAVGGRDLATVETDAEEAVAEYLDPAKWGRDPAFTEAATGDQTWVETSVVRYNKILQIIMTTEGIDYVTSLQIGVQGQPLAEVDVPLTTPAALTQPGAIDGNVT